MRIKNIFIISAIATLLIGSGFGVYFIVQNLKQRKQYADFYKVYTQHYNDRLAVFEEENKTLRDVDVVFLGDSLTEGYDLKTYYPEYNVANRGIGGDTTDGLQKRLKVSVYDINPKMVMMLISVNNLDTMLNNYEDIVISLKDTKDNNQEKERKPFHFQSFFNKYSNEKIK